MKKLQNALELFMGGYVSIFNIKVANENVKYVFVRALIFCVLLHDRRKRADKKSAKNKEDRPIITNDTLKSANRTQIHKLIFKYSIMNGKYI